MKDVKNDKKEKIVIREGRKGRKKSLIYRKYYKGKILE